MTASDRNIALDEYRIRTAIFDYANLADCADNVSEIADLFAPAAKLCIRGDEWQGREAVASCLAGMRVQGGVGPGSRKAHVLTNVSVRIIDSTRATARSRFLLIDSSGGTPIIVVTGQYVDEFLRDNDEWLIFDRTILRD
jgi:hypothetical protein